MNAGETLAYGFVSVGVEPEALVGAIPGIVSLASSAHYACDLERSSASCTAFIGSVAQVLGELFEKHTLVGGRDGRVEDASVVLAQGGEFPPCAEELELRQAQRLKLLKLVHAAFLHGG